MGWNKFLMEETEYDKNLNIRTTGRDDTMANRFNYPYEPTPYRVLERLANSGYITKKNTLIDYGSGKGRVDFFLSYHTRCRSVGIEYDRRIFETAISNKAGAVSGRRCEFINQSAESQPVPPEADRFYFFNPFSVEVLEAVLVRIWESFETSPRELLLFFYYPSDEYISFLEKRDELVILDEINCRDIFLEEDKREKILVYVIKTE